MRRTEPLKAKPAPALTLSVTLHWQGDLITARHLDSPSTVAVGEVKGALAPIPCEVLGYSGFVFARLEDGKASAHVPLGATATRTGPDGRATRVEGPRDEALEQGASIELHVGAFCLRAAASAPDVLPRGGRPRGRYALSIAFAAAAHATILGLAAQVAAAAEPDTQDDERTADLRALLVTAEQRARAADELVPPDDGMAGGRDVDQRSGDGRAAGGARAAQSEGAMGDRDSRATEHRRYAAARRAPDEPKPVLSREAAMNEAISFGMIGLLSGSATAAPTPWFGEDETRGADAISARGELFATSLGSAHGAAGLGLTGIGEGGGGRGEGIGLGAIGTIGHRDGPPGSGIGGGGEGAGGGGRGGAWCDGSIGILGHGRRGSSVIKAKRAWWSNDNVSVSGRLPPEAVQRIIRQNFGRLRFCYDSALVHTPDLAGRVSVRFVIGRDGAVSQVADGGSSMPDPAVVACVLRTFYGISFPQPEGGVVTVTYPILFSPAAVDAAGHRGSGGEQPQSLPEPRVVHPRDDRFSAR